MIDQLPLKLGTQNTPTLTNLSYLLQGNHLLDYHQSLMYVVAGRDKVAGGVRRSGHQVTAVVSHPIQLVPLVTLHLLAGIC